MKAMAMSKAGVAAVALSAMLAGCSGEAGPVAGNFEGWNQNGAANWRIENGEFVATDGGNGTLVTQQSYGDVHVTAEFFVDAGNTNSGIFIRAADPARISDTTAYEVNIYDERPDQSGRTGGIVNIAAPSQTINAAGKWSTYDITAEGDHIVVVLDGVTTVDIHDSTYTSGPIALQYGGAGEVRFRNVKIEPL
jgi:hypothetical protein